MVGTCSQGIISAWGGQYFSYMYNTPELDTQQIKQGICYTLDIMSPKHISRMVTGNCFSVPTAFNLPIQIFTSVTI